MSFILDALRKSEHERQQSAGPGSLAGAVGHAAGADAALGSGRDRRARGHRARARRRMVAEPPAVRARRRLRFRRSSSAASSCRRPACGRALRPQQPAPTRALVAAIRRCDGRVLAGGRGRRDRAPPSRSSKPSAPALSSQATRFTRRCARAAERGRPRRGRRCPAGVAARAARLQRRSQRDRFVFINGRKYVEGERLDRRPAARVDRADRCRARVCRAAVRARAGVTGVSPRRRRTRSASRRRSCGSLTPNPTAWTSSAGGRSASFSTSSKLLRGSSHSACASRGISKGMRS